MTLPKHFLRKEPDFIQISRFKIAIGILIGLFFAFGFYSLLYMFREVFRMLSLTDAYDLWILTDKEVHFYNLIFAYISCILGQSVAISFLFVKPKTFFGKRNYRKITILNDQSALNWYFLIWFAKLALFFGLFFGYAIRGGYYAFSFYPKYNYIFILIIIVLFLQTWNTLRLTFKGKSIKWMLTSIVVISAVAFGFSRINLSDYKSINQNILQKNIYYSYTLELPEAECYERLYNRPLINNIYIVESKIHKTNPEPIIVADYEQLAIEKIKDKILFWQSITDDFQIPHMVFRLHIHKSIKMDFVNRVKDELAKSGISKIAYAVVPINHEFDERFYPDYSFPMTLPDLNENSLNPDNRIGKLENIQNIIEIEQFGADYLINNSLIKPNQIKDFIKALIHQNSDYTIKYFVNQNLDFSDYFRVLSSAKKAINELRNEYSEEKYLKQFDLLEYEEKAEVCEKLPFRIFEITTGV